MQLIRVIIEQYHIYNREIGMRILRFIYNNNGLIQLYFFATAISFGATTVLTDFLRDIEKLNFIINVTVNNNVIDRIALLTLLSSLIYTVYYAIYKIIIKLRKGVRFENKHKISDSIIKSLVLSNGASISGIMYATTLHVYNNPQGFSSASEYFLVTTIFTLLMITILLALFYNLNFLREEFKFKMP